MTANDSAVVAAPEGGPGPGQVSAAPQIRRLTVERFRGVRSLTWHPAPGVNLVLGGGDAGKTTILEAIALLLSPSNATVLSATDYWEKVVKSEFSIEAVVALPEATGINLLSRQAWPWIWNGSDITVPSSDEATLPAPTTEPVYRLRVRGTDDLDLSYEIVQPDESTIPLSIALRRRIGLVRLGAEDRNDRDLRLIYGSALERMLADRTLRARLAERLGAEDLGLELEPDVSAKLKELDAAFVDRALPSHLELGLTASPGVSLGAFVGLTARSGGVQLPVACWGAGTRRLASLAISEQGHVAKAITVVDEIERGLEPYRLRTLLRQLMESGAQVFATTHSPIALNACARASLWYVDYRASVGRLPCPLMPGYATDTEAYLSRLTVVAEGVTEVGFLRALLRRALGRDALDYGIWVADGGGNEKARILLEKLGRSGLAYGGFVDDEGTGSGTWATLKATLGPLLFQWKSGCLEENVLPLVAPDRWEEFITDCDGESGARRRTLAERLGIEDKSWGAIRDRASDLVALIVAAATGSIPGGLDREDAKAFRRHAQQWFKSEAGGDELLEKVFKFGLWPQLEPELLPFLNAIRAAVGLPPIQSIAG